MTGMRPQSDDTSLDAEERQFAIWRSMTPAQKFAAFLELQDLGVALAEAGIRRRHPGIDDREVFLRRVAMHLDRETMQKCYGWVPPEEGTADAGTSKDPGT